MNFKSISLAALALTAGVTAAQAQQFAYTPGTQKYRLTSTMKMTQEMMGQKQEAELNTNEVITFAVTPKGRDSLAFSVTIDSASVTSNGPQGSPDVSKRIGSKVSGVMSSLGKVYTFQAPTDDAGGLSYQGYKTFLVRVPSGALKAGMSWVDTTETKNSNNGIDVTAQTIVTSKIVGDTTVGGQKAWKVQRNTNTTLTGSGNQQGQALVLEGKGTGTATEVISSRGVYIGSDGTTNVDMTVTVPGVGMTIPITQVVTSKVEMVGAKK
jgi:hypothetical protein